LQFGGSVQCEEYGRRSGEPAAAGDAARDQQRGITIRGSGTEAGSSRDPGGARVLRAKYLDWCSAQLADHFLALSPEEIFELAERAAQEGPGGPGRSLSSSAPETDGDEGGEGSYSELRSLVELVTGVLADQLELPTYEEWLELYEADAAAVEERLLGFWKDV
jgi:hypothetical protein